MKNKSRGWKGVLDSKLAKTTTKNTHQLRLVSNVSKTERGTIVNHNYMIRGHNAQLPKRADKVTSR